jgi:hypothetical protein
LRCYIFFYLFRIPSIVETETNRQLFLKFKKPENGELTSNTSMSTEYLINDQQQNGSTTTTNGHNDSLTIQSASSSDQTTETLVLDISNSILLFYLFSHTKELLDEALDSVKNVLMQTFKKNLESGGDLKYRKNNLLKNFK